MKIHMIGIGGSGMSALARFYLAKGFSVSGSDKSNSQIILDLKKEGADIFENHKADNIPNDCNLVVYSCAIPKENEERRFAEEKQIKLRTYFEALGEALESYNLTAVAGTHGKTTTTAMLALALTENKLDPTVFIGSNVTQLQNKNFRFGNSKAAIAEACEYRQNFLNLSPTNLLITNLDYDHPDSYANKEEYLKSFYEFAAKLPEDGLLIIPSSEPAEIWQKHTEAEILEYDTQDLPSEVKLEVPGKHNRENAALVYKFLESIKENNKAKTKKALEKFSGTSRRFEIIGKKEKTTFISDYAHHPTEILATLSAAKEKYGKEKIVAVFQPHQFSRTRVFLKDFGKAFKAADEVIISEIYEARDTKEDKKSVSTKKLVEEISKYNSKVELGGNLKETAEKIKQNNNQERVVILMGAGNIPEIFNLI